MRKHLVVLVLLALGPAVALTQDTSAARTSGSFSTRGYLLDHPANSSKFTEYRDLRDPENVYLSDFRYDALGRRVIERIGRRNRRGAGRLCHRLGNLGLDSDAVELLWGLRLAADVRARQPQRRHGALLDDG